MTWHDGEYTLLDKLEDVGGIMEDGLFRRWGALWMRSPGSNADWDRGRPILLVRVVGGRACLVVGRNRRSSKWMQRVVTVGKWDQWRSVDVRLSFAEKFNLWGSEVTCSLFGDDDG